MPSPSSITPGRAARLEAALRLRQPSLTVVFENVHDAHNVAAVLRSCDAVGVTDVHAIYHSGQKEPKLSTKSSGSARKWVDLHLYTDVVSCFSGLRQKGMQILTTHMSSDALSIHDVDFTKPTAIVFGNEHAGVTEQTLALADANILVPQVGVVQSLNISVACAVTLYEAYRQRLLAGMYAADQMTDEEFLRRRSAWFDR